MPKRSPTLALDTPVEGCYRQYCPVRMKYFGGDPLGRINETHCPVVLDIRETRSRIRRQYKWYAKFFVSWEGENDMATTDPFYYSTAEIVEPTTVDALLNQLSNSLAQCHAAMDRIDPPTPALNDLKVAEPLSITRDLAMMISAATYLGERINRVGAQLGRPV